MTAVHEFHIWRLVGECIIATVHIHFGNLNDFLQAADVITKYFHQSGIHSVTIQPEFDEVCNFFFVFLGFRYVYRYSMLLHFL